MDNEKRNNQDDQIRNLMGFGSSSIRKSYYPELQSKIHELNLEKEKFERIFSEALNGVFQADINGKIIIANPAMIKLCGYQTIEEFLSLSSIGDDIFADKKDLDRLMELLTEKESVMNFEALIETAQGMIIDVSINASMIKREDSVFLECVVQDISERKKAQNYISNIINSMPSALIAVDQEGMITQWNRGAEQFFSVTEEKAHGSRIEEIIPYITKDIPNIRKVITGVEKVMKIKHSRIVNYSPVYEDMYIYPLNSKGNEGAVIRIDNVTEQVRIQEMMIQSEKMLSVGGLAAGMAHEINNPLAGMMQTAEVMGKRLSNPTIPANIKAAEKAGITMESIDLYMKERGILKMVKAIKTSGKRAASIIENMLSFARKDNMTTSYQNIVELLDNILDLAETDFNLKEDYDFRNIRIIKEYEENLPLIPCVKSQIQQVILNLLRNGSEAMSEISNREKLPFFILRLKKEAEMIRIEIEDNGPGMDNKTRKRIFEPFFTTKPVDIGTGLGLSVSYFIITENHKGTMNIESEPGKGAKFILRLPLKLSDDE